MVVALFIHIVDASADRLSNVNVNTSNRNESTLNEGNCPKCVQMDLKIIHTFWRNTWNCIIFKLPETHLARIPILGGGKFHFYLRCSQIALTCHLPTLKVHLKYSKTSRTAVIKPCRHFWISIQRKEAKM